MRFRQKSDDRCAVGGGATNSTGQLVPRWWRAVLRSPWLRFLGGAWLLSWSASTLELHGSGAMLLALLIAGAAGLLHRRDDNGAH